jgi:hypothetical protein
MNRRTILKMLGAGLLPVQRGAAQRKTEVEIAVDRFRINGRPTYAGRTWRGMNIEGLLMNSRMVQGIFDDLNEATRGKWAYPDTKRWDPERNTREFAAAMAEWRRSGLLSFTINLQGGSPEGYSQDQPWHNSAFRPDGSLRPDYLNRLERILDRADDVGMVPIVGYFYFGQDQRLESDAAVKRSVSEATTWLLKKDYRNVLVEIANECDNQKYEQPSIQVRRVDGLIKLAQSITVSGRRLPVSVSFNGGTIPPPHVVSVADFLLLHGNGVKTTDQIGRMVNETRQVRGYRNVPILFNEDDHFDFDKPRNNFIEAVSQYASWGLFDYRRKGEGLDEGYQSVPVNWGISSERKRQFFSLLKEMTGVS